MKLLREKTQLLVIDMQERLLPVVFNGDAIAARVCVLTEAARLLGVPISISEQYPRGLGPTINSVLKAAGTTARPFEKMSFSCLGDKEMASHLTRLAATRRQIVICGIEAHVCVMQTALDLLNHGYDVAVVTDAVGSRDTASKDVALLRSIQAGVTPITTEMVIFEWLAAAGTPEFRSMLPLIK